MDQPGLFTPAMADDRAIEAIRRIDRALARIEAATASQPAPRGDEELKRLREVHQALRDKVEGAISQIDRLLAAGERA